MASWRDPVGSKGEGRRKACRFEGKVESRKTATAEPLSAAVPVSAMAGACVRVCDVEVSEDVVLAAPAMLRCSALFRLEMPNPAEAQVARKFWWSRRSKKIGWPNQSPTLTAKHVTT